MTGDTYRDSIFVEAAPEKVFEYFTRPDALVRWMGDSATLEPWAGGLFSLVMGGRTVQGRYLEVQQYRRVVISWGRLGARQFPPESSTLEVNLEREGQGTRVHVVHSGLPPAELERHSTGWRHYLQRLRLAAVGRDPGPHIVPKGIRLPSG